MKIFNEGEGINPEEEDESDEDADEVDEDEIEEEDVDEEEEVNLNDNNQFSFIEEIKLSIDEIDNELLDDEMEKAIKKRTEEKKD